VRPERRTFPRFLVSSRGVCCGVAIAAAACEKQPADRADSSASSVVAAAASPTRIDSAPRAESAGAPARAVTTATCVSEGDWQPCSVQKRLTDAGYVPIDKGPSPAGVFPVPGTTYALGPARLHVYLFKSAKDREQAIAAIDTTAVSRRGRVAPWPTRPTRITSNNLVGVLESDNGQLIERVQLAITAGLPRQSR
jgi:hypothetical protein